MEGNRGTTEVVDTTVDFSSMRTRRARLGWMPEKWTEKVLLVWTLFASAWVLYMPVSHNEILLPLMASLGVIAVYLVIRRRAHLDKRVLVPAAAWAVFLLYGSVVAAIAGAPNWTRVMFFLLVLPLFYVLLTAVFTRAFVRPLFYLGAGVSIFAAAILVSQSAAAVGLMPFLELPAPFHEFINLVFEVDEDGPLRFTSHALPPMLWWGAMWIASLFVRPKSPYLPPVAVRASAAILCFAAAFLSLRRAMIVVLMVAPVLAMAVAIALYVKNRTERSVGITWSRALLVVGVYVAASAIILVIQPRSFEVFTPIVNSSSELIGVEGGVTGEPSHPVTLEDCRLSGDEVPPTDSEQPEEDLSTLETKACADLIRANESSVLLSADTPAEAIFGRGLGATVDRGQYVRPEMAARPWQSELSYHLAYYWTGYVGLLMIAVLGLSTLIPLRAAIRRAGDLDGALFVASTGAVALVIVNASNPYLQALGHMWPVFFPFMIANAILRKAPAAQESADSAADA